MNEKGSEVLCDNKFNTSKQYKITTKKVNAILSCINKSTVSRSYTTDLIYQVTSLCN